MIPRLAVKNTYLTVKKVVMTTTTLQGSSGSIYVCIQRSVGRISLSSEIVLLLTHTKEDGQKYRENYTLVDLK